MSAGEFRLRVYWEDTDAGGIVYYANYLKFIERARTEALLGLGVSQVDLRERFGVIFAVAEANVRFLAPARLEDQLVVTTRAGEIGGARLTMEQDIRRGETCLAKCRVTLVCLGPEGRAARIPAELRAMLGKLPTL
jgi:acyl-CoA thioester hydrolase